MILIIFLLFQLSERARERKVPVTRIGRLVNFGGTLVYWFPILDHLNITVVFVAIYLVSQNSRAESAANADIPNHCQCALQQG